MSLNLSEKHALRKKRELRANEQMRPLCHLLLQVIQQFILRFVGFRERRTKTAPDTPTRHRGDLSEQPERDARVARRQRSGVDLELKSR